MHHPNNNEEDAKPVAEFVGNSGRPIHRVKNLQRSITAEHRANLEKAKEGTEE